MSATPELNKALANFKLELPKILEDKNVKIPTKTGGTIAFTYATLDQILQQITPVLSQHQLVLSSFTGFIEDKFVLITTLRHSSGEFIQSSFPLPFDPNGDPKDAGGKISYGRRYNVNCLLELYFADSEDRKEVVRQLAHQLKKEADLVPKPTPTTGEKHVDRDLVYREIDSLIKRKNFEIEQAKNMLVEKYGVNSRQHLNDSQLINFLELLRLRPANHHQQTAS